MSTIIRIVPCVTGQDAVRAYSIGPRRAINSIQMIGAHAMPSIMGRPVFINRFFWSESENSFMASVKKREFRSVRREERQVFSRVHTPV
jgi:hypothetical protein